MNTVANVQTMTSLEIVEMINKERFAIEALTGKPRKVLTHDNFLKKVVQVLGEEGAVKFNGSYFSQQNKELPMYIFPKREATLMAMSYSPAISAAVYDKMTALEEQVAQNVLALPNFSNPAEAARAWAVEYERGVALTLEVEQKKELLAIAAPKVEFVDEFVDAQGALGIQAASRLLKMNMRELGHWLVDAKLCFRRPPANTLIPYSAKIDQGLFVVKTGLRPGSEGPHAFEQMKITTKGLTSRPHLPTITAFMGSTAKVGVRYEKFVYVSRLLDPVGGISG